MVLDTRKHIGVNQGFNVSNGLSSGGSVSLLLNDYPNATFAVSLRRLDNTYSGNCIKIRRSSDNAELDIGFVNNMIDTAAMLAFCGAGDGLVSIWYDQSGGIGNATQVSLVNQPKIVSAGVVNIINGLPIIDFELKTNPYSLLLPTGYLNGTTEISLFGTWDITEVAGSNAGVFAPSTTNSKGLEVLQVSAISYPSYLRINGSQRDANTGASYRMWDDAQSLTTIIGDAVDLSVYKNASAVSLTNSSALPALNYNGMYSIGRYSGGLYMDGKIQEIVVYESNESANRVGIETNINDYYAIY